jgi:5-hydroxyisourate hydrolase-like protein (transthyretin family)
MNHPLSGPGALRLRPLLFSVFSVSLFLLLLYSSHLLADPADSDPVDAAAAGSIAGVVTDGGGQPLAGVQVQIYRNDNFFGPEFPFRTATTNEFGAYKVPVLGAGIYRLRFVDPSQALAVTFYQDATTYEEARELLIMGNNLTGIDAVLEPAGHITGMVTLVISDTLYTALTAASPNYMPVFPSVVIKLYRQVGNGWVTLQTRYVNTLQTIYDFGELAAGRYRICAETGVYYGGFQSPRLAKCYDNIVSGVANATDVPLAAGQTISNINILLGNAADLAELGGRVTSSAGVPLAGVEVYASHQLSIGYWYTSYYTRTDSMGYYQMHRLLPGAYLLQFVDRQGPYLSEYYLDAIGPDTATALTLRPGERVTDANAQLELGGLITGQVTILGEAVPQTGQVYLVRQDDMAWFSLPSATFDWQTGRYSSGGLRPGRYQVFASATLDDNSYYGTYGPAPGQVTDLPLATGEIKGNIDIALGQDQFEGVITGVVTYAGNPLPGIRVELYRYTWRFAKPFLYTQTDTQGRYRIDGLTYNTYFVAFRDRTGLYATSYYSGNRELEFSRGVYVNSTVISGLLQSGVVSNVNAALVLGSTIQGQVRQRDDSPVVNALVQLFWNDPIGNWRHSSFYTRTDAAGRYDLQGLPAGVYRLGVEPADSNGYTEYYGSFYEYDLYTARDISVTVGSTITGIDLLLGPDRKYYLPIIAP